MSPSPRHQRAFLDDKYQSLRAPLQLMCDSLGSLKALSAIHSRAGFSADIEKMRGAASAIEVVLEGLAGEGVDDTVLSRLRHDLRNHIGIVDGYSEILAEDCDDDQAALLLSQLRQQSRLFQEQLEGLVLPKADSAGELDPIANIFRSFKSGLSREPGDASAALILLVDDNASGRELLAQQLQRKGYTVLEAASGRECLEVMARVMPDLLLLDLVMTDMNGYEVLQALREDEQLRNIPVVMISGVQDEQGAIHCIDAGASDYLIKPVNATLLDARLSALLERKRWQDKERDYLAELERNQKFIRRIFGRYLSDEVVERLLDQKDGLELGGQRREVTVLMADIRDFSTISQQLQPEACVALLNNYLGSMAEVIQRYRGTVDELMGDGILAIFGAPVTEADDCDRALACAVAMQQAMVGVNERARQQGLPEIKVGIGLNTGEVVAGNIGSELRSKYGVVGHNVNLTARVESCTVGGQILVTPSTLAAAKLEVVTGQQLEVAVKGAQEKLRLHEVLGVGLPYDLLLEPSVADVRKLTAPISLELMLLSGKQLDESQRLAVRAVAVRDDSLLLQGELAMNMPVEVAVQGLGDQRCYGKLLASPAAREGDEYSARLVLASAADLLAKLK